MAGKCDKCGCVKVCILLRKAKLEEDDLEIWKDICTGARDVEEEGYIKWDTFIKIFTLHRRTCT
jgi:hypothetical protein